MKLHKIVLLSLTMQSLNQGLFAGDSLKQELFQAIAGKDQHKVSDMLRRNPELIRQTGIGYMDFTPLMVAIDELGGKQDFMGKVIIRDLVQKHGADLHNQAGRSALEVAASMGKLPAVELLLEMGADPNFESEEGSTPLTKAAHQAQAYLKDDHLKIVRRLLEAGANASAQGYQGKTALEHLRAIQDNVRRKYGNEDVDSLMHELEVAEMSRV